MPNHLPSNSRRAPPDFKAVLASTDRGWEHPANVPKVCGIVPSAAGIHLAEPVAGDKPWISPEFQFVGTGGTQPDDVD